MKPYWLYRVPTGSRDGSYNWSWTRTRGVKVAALAKSNFVAMKWAAKLRNLTHFQGCAYKPKLRDLLGSEKEQITIMMPLLLMNFKSLENIKGAKCCKLWFHIKHLTSHLAANQNMSRLVFNPACEMAERGQASILCLGCPPGCFPCYQARFWLRPVMVAAH